MKIQPFQLERFFAEYEFKTPYLLCASDCESFTIGELLDLEPNAPAALHNHWLGYTESQGSPDLRAEIAALYQQLNPDQILVHTGAEEAIFNFMQVSLNPGDHIIVHYPCYQSLFEVAHALGCQVTLWEAAEKEGWDLDLDRLRRQLQPNTKAIIVNCPHNPTGYLLSREKLQQLIDLVHEHDLLLFSDEVYRGLEYDPADQLPAACDLSDRAISLGVMSKTYGLAGLRIGWIATRHSETYRAMAAFKDYTTICNSAPGEFLAALALRHKEKIVRRNLDILLSNLDLLNRFFAAHSHIFNWRPPQAGPIAFPSLKQGRDVDSFCRDLIEKQGVLLAPASTFNFPHNNFRVGFGRKNLPQALARLETYLQENT